MMINDDLTNNENNATINKIKNEYIYKNSEKPVNDKKIKARIIT